MYVAYDQAPPLVMQVFSAKRTHRAQDVAIGLEGWRLEG